MGRIRFAVIRVELSTYGFSVGVSLFDEHTVILSESYEKLTWKEARQLVEDLTDQYRPGTELLRGGVQEPLF